METVRTRWMIIEAASFVKHKKTSQKAGITDSFDYNAANMKFVLIDKVLSFEPGTELTATKSVSLAEEYLGDHFPIFPVLPGVLLLEGMIESASWLVRVTEAQRAGVIHSMVLLSSAKNVKYKSFAAPGTKIEYCVRAKAIEENLSSFTGTGVCGDEPIVEARFSLRHFNLAEDKPAMAATDAVIIENMKKRWKLLYQ
ncbi:MAG: beta-hydroxyacyl-ACP dehydratase [Planctomycetes bacterium]|nr:beta-hydroxyacyl-ACP dehydratase [Planctomycetota bacterium]